MTKTEVLRKLRDLRTDLDSGLPIPNDRLTVGAFLDRWVTRNLPGQISGVTLDSYANTVRLHLAPAFGRTVLRKLTVLDVDGSITAKRKAGYSANSQRIIKAVLRRALHQAQREGLVARNVVALSAAPRIRAKEGRALTIIEARRLLDAVGAPGTRPC